MTQAKAGLSGIEPNGSLLRRVSHGPKSACVYRGNWHIQKAAGRGSVVNNASVLGIRPYPELSLYNASKFAVIGLTKTAALEYATQGIRVNAVCPAIIETDMTAIAREDEQTRDRLLLTHPVRRFGTPEEVADAVLWLCSPTSGFITGVSLPVDGGFTV